MLCPSFRMFEKSTSGVGITFSNSVVVLGSTTTFVVPKGRREKICRKAVAKNDPRELDRNAHCKGFFVLNYLQYIEIHSKNEGTKTAPLGRLQFLPGSLLILYKENSVEMEIMRVRIPASRPPTPTALTSCLDTNSINIVFTVSVLVW